MIETDGISTTAAVPTLPLERQGHRAKQRHVLVPWV